METNRYRQAMEAVKTPPRLKEETRALMQKELKKQRAARRWKPVLYGAAALAAVFLAAVGLRLGRDSGPIVTPLHQGEWVTLVELTDGALQFAAVEQGMNHPIQLAPPYPIRQSLPLEALLAEHPRLLPPQAPQGFGAAEGGATAYAGQLGEAPAATTLGVTYSGEQGARLLLTGSDDPDLVASPVEMTSQMGGEPVGVGYDAGTGTCWGLYRREGFTLLLTAQGVTQEEFILLLRHFTLP